MIILEKQLQWQDIAAIARGKRLELSPAAWVRIEHAAAIVAELVASGVRGYGINTGVGALADTVITQEQQSRLSRKIILSHACGVGPLLEGEAVRAVMAAQIANFAHGHSGVRAQIVRHLLTMLDCGCVPHVPSRGSAGYLTHNAHIALVLIGEGRARFGNEDVSGRDALLRCNLEPITLGAKEGLSLVNGTACSTGILGLALARAQALLDWADAAAALTFEALGGQMTAYSEDVLALYRSPGLAASGKALRSLLEGSQILAASQGRRTQDALSLRAVPHAHGALRDMFAFVAQALDNELGSVTDNPAVAGRPGQPLVWSQAHAVSPALGQAADSFALSLTQIGMMSERRIDRLVNPLVSGLPGFLARDAGENSGFMIAQYTASALCSENRRLAAPASTDGGITSGLQEDFLAHPTAAANKLISIIANVEYILAIELMAAAQAHDLQPEEAARAQGTERIHQFIRQYIQPYYDDRPLGDDIEALRNAIHMAKVPLMTQDR